MRFMDKVIHIHRNVTTMGQYNRPTHTVQEVGKCMGGIDKGSGGHSVIQGNPQPQIIERYVVYAEPDADIRANDWLVIDGVRYRASNPTMRYRTHQEVDVQIDEEI